MIPGLLVVPLLLGAAAPGHAGPGPAGPAVPALAGALIPGPTAAGPADAGLTDAGLTGAGLTAAGLTDAGLAGAPGAAVPAFPAAPAGAGACPGQAVPPGPPAKEEAGAAVAPLPVPDPPVGGLTVCAEAHVGPVPPPPVGVASYLVADLDTGAVLAARAPHARHRPASTIKLLLAMVVDRALPPEQVVTGTVEDANIEGSRAGIGPGGRYTVDQLLHGLLLASGNDAAHALTRELGGGPTTLAAMQDVARHLGAADTRPATPSGLDGPGASSSAYDLALILHAALERPRIAAILRTPAVPFPGFAGRPGFVLGNDDRLLGTPGFLGGKNGFTDAARHTFVGAVERGGRRLVVALVRGESRPVRMVDQARALLDWGFGTPGGTAVGTLVAPGAGPGSALPDPAAAPDRLSGPGLPAGPDPLAPPGSGAAAGAVPGTGAPGIGADGPGPGVPAAVVVGGVAAAVGLAGLLAGLLTVVHRRRR
nr:serine hydrolase [Pseudonocardia sp. C8]